MLTYDGLGTEDVTLMLTETWNPRDVRKVVKQASVLTGTENAVDVMWTQLFLEQMIKIPTIIEKNIHSCSKEACM